MPDRIPHGDPVARVHRRAADGRASRAEVTALVEKAALVADGLVLLQHAPLECVAILLGVEPHTVERVRAALEDPALRDEAAAAFARAAGARRAASAPTAPRAAAPRDPEALLRVARAREDGLALLLTAAPEAAAVAFGVHPELVHRARDLAPAAPQPTE